METNMDNNLVCSVTNDKALELLAASNDVIDKLEALIAAYKKLETVATHDEVKAHCLKQASFAITEKGIVIWKLGKEGVTQVQ